MSRAKNCLTIHVDGASRGNPGPAGIGVVIEDEQGITKARISGYIGETTNNVDIRTDSKLLAEQVQGNYKVRNASLRLLFQQVKQLLADFESFTITFIPRYQNATADALANKALDRHSKGV